MSYMERIPALLDDALAGRLGSAAAVSVGDGGREVFRYAARPHIESHCRRASALDGNERCLVLAHRRVEIAQREESAGDLRREEHGRTGSDLGEIVVPGPRHRRREGRGLTLRRRQPEAADHGAQRKAHPLRDDHFAVLNRQSLQHGLRKETVEQPEPGDRGVPCPVARLDGKHLDRDGVAGHDAFDEDRTGDGIDGAHIDRFGPAGSGGEEALDRLRRRLEADDLARTHAQDRLGIRPKGERRLVGRNDVHGSLL